MSNIENLGNFPHTIGNLDDRPSLTGAQMKAAFEKDVMALWARLAACIPYINEIIPVSRLVDVVNSSSTDSGVPTAKAVYDAIADASLGGIAQQIIEDWLDAHPEATTTVQDGSITNAKLSTSFATPGVASEYVANTEYPAGSYVFHGGALYTNPDDVSDAVWTSGHWKTVELGDDVLRIINALDKLYNGTETITFNTVKNSYPDRSTGDFVAYNNWDRTDYIPVNGGEKIYVNNIYVTNDNCFYDSSKSYISGFTIPIGSPAVIKVPDNAAFMVCSNSSVANRFFKAFYRQSKIVTDTLLTVKRPVTRKVSSVSFTSGYVDKDGQAYANATYFYTSKIQVKEGDVIYPVILPSNVRPIRCVCAYNGATVVSDKGSNTELADGFTVPSGITDVVLSCYAPSTDVTFVQETEEVLTGLRNNKSRRAISAKASSLTANEDIKIPEGSYLNNKKNCAYAFWAEFSTFNKVVIGHGTSYYGTTYIEIDTTNVTVREGLSNTKVGEYAHGLTFADFIAVSIKVDNGYLPKATVTINTNGGQFVQTDVPFVGCYGDIFAHGTTALTNVKFSYSMFDLDTDMMIFGDSYASLQDVNRWPYHVMNKGFSEFMLCGFSGATSAEVLEAFKQMMYFRQPKYIAWFLGMNDPDDENAYNASWKSCIDYVISEAKDIGAEVILATIPNTPTVNNTKKNAWIKSSGYRYVDFADAVGANAAGSSWYTGMLSNDNVHPTQYGARALAARLLVDLPEIK